MILLDIGRGHSCRNVVRKKCLSVWPKLNKDEDHIVTGLLDLTPASADLSGEGRVTYM